MRRAFAFSALIYAGHASEDMPAVCRLGEDFGEDGTACQAAGDVLIQKGILRKHAPGEEGEPPAEATATAQTMEPPPGPPPRSTTGQLGTFTPGVGVSMWPAGSS